MTLRGCKVTASPRQSEGIGAGGGHGGRERVEERPQAPLLQRRRAQTCACRYAAVSRQIRPEYLPQFTCSVSYRDVRYEKVWSRSGAERGGRRRSRRCRHDLNRVLLDHHRATDTSIIRARIMGGAHGRAEGAARLFAPARRVHVLYERHQPARHLLPRGHVQRLPAALPAVADVPALAAKKPEEGAQLLLEEQQQNHCGHAASSSSNRSTRRKQRSGMASSRPRRRSSKRRCFHSLRKK